MLPKAMVCFRFTWLMLSILLSNSTASDDFKPYHMDLRKVLKTFETCLVKITRAYLSDQVLKFNLKQNCGKIMKKHSN